MKTNNTSSSSTDTHTNAQTDKHTEAEYAYFKLAINF